MIWYDKFGKFTSRIRSLIVLGRIWVREHKPEGIVVLIQGLARAGIRQAITMEK